MNYKSSMKLPELLAPAGSFEHLKAAVQAGADAVYFGGSRFGARAYAENFTKEKVIEGLDYIHFHDRRAYMTVNTLVKEKELQEHLYDYLLPFYEAGLDGVIVQDLGAASFIREHFPGMEVHGSTQMTITGVAGALEAKKMGMNRVVPARELSMEEVLRIKKETGLEVEVFIHGALCYCYSGQCLFSSMYGGRSGNRGRCAQPCRLPYRLYDAAEQIVLDKPKHLLSPKDLYSLTNLPSMIEMGVDSLKIEGRMKNVDYVAGVVSVYRKYLDQYRRDQKWNVDPKDKETLEELYSRSGFTSGYWTLHNGSEMMSIDTPRHLGLEIGVLRGIQKNRLNIELNQRVSPKDLLVIPGGREEEVVLTVPANLETVLQKKKKGYEILLNAPKTRWLKPGLKVYRRHNESLQAEIERDILSKNLKYPVTGSMTICKDEPMVLILESRGDTVTVTGGIPSLAQNRPLSKEDVLRQMKKTGNIPFTLESFDIYLEDGLFIQASLLKEMRQKGYEQLEAAHAHRFHRSLSALADLSDDNVLEKIPDKMPNDLLKTERDSWHNSEKEYIASVYDEKIFGKCLENSFFRGILLSMDFEDASMLLEKKQRIHESGKKACLSLPRVLRQESAKSFEKYLLKTVEDGEEWDVIYINNINEISLVQKLWPQTMKVYGASCYSWNHKSREELLHLQDLALQELGENSRLQTEVCFDLPYELSGKECLESMECSSLSSQKSQVSESFGCEDLNYECLIYGRFPVMASAQCLKKTTGRCNHRAEILQLQDRKNRKLPVSTHCHPGWTDDTLAVSKRTAQSCYNLIWTDEPRNLIGEDYTVLADHTRRYRFDFFESDVREIETVVSSFKKWEEKAFEENASLTGNESMRRLPTEHWTYGIE